MSATAHIALVGDHDASVTAHRAIPLALQLASDRVDAKVDWSWVGTGEISSVADLDQFTAIWVVPASPYRNDDGAFLAIRHARESGKTFLGTCGGYQYAALEFIRNVLGYPQAGNAEVDPETEMPVIGALTCALRDVSGSVTFVDGSRMAQLNGQTRVSEGYSCGFGVNPQYMNLFQNSDLTFTGFDDAGDPRAFEHRTHPFYIGTAFQPERAALADQSHPLVEAFVNSAIQRMARVA